MNDGMGIEQAKDLLQGKALGCLDPEENATLTRLMEEDSEFPWQELGQYQNLVAFLPTLLDIETPDSEIKDNVARRLYEYGEKIKAEETVEEIPENEPEIDLESDLDKIEEDGVVIQEEEISEPEIPTEDVTEINMGKDLETIDEELGKIEENGVVIKEEEILEPEAPVADPFQEDKPQIKKGISFKKHDVLKGPFGKTKEPEHKVLLKQPPSEPISRTGSLRKEFDKRKVKSYVSKATAPEPVDDGKFKKLVLISIIASVIALILIIIFYFKLSSDIQDNQDEIQKLKEQLHSEVLLDENFSFQNHTS